jgi:hypothetical protein
MPSTSKKQHNFMEMVAHNPGMAKKVGVPQSVGKDFTEADKGKKFGVGGGIREDLQTVNKKKTDHGDTKLFKKGGKAMEKESKSEMRKEMAEDKKQDIAMIKKAFKEHDAQEHKGGKGTKITLKKGGKVRGDGIATKGKTKGRMC